MVKQSQDQGFMEVALLVKVVVVVEVLVVVVVVVEILVVPVVVQIRPDEPVNI